MFALVKNDTIKLFGPHVIFEDKDGTQYSPETLLTWSASEKQDKGIYDVAFGNRPDDQYYEVTQNTPEFDAEEKIVKITYTSVDKPLGDTITEVVDLEGTTVERKTIGLKTKSIADIKGFANSSLSATDWMLVRKIERNIDVPAATVTYRAAVVAESNRLETAINAATTVAQLITAVQSASWPTAE